MVPWKIMRGELRPWFNPLWSCRMWRTILPCRSPCTGIPVLTAADIWRNKERHPKLQFTKRIYYQSGIGYLPLWREIERDRKQFTDAYEMLPCSVKHRPFRPADQNYNQGRVKLLLFLVSPQVACLEFHLFWASNEEVKGTNRARWLMPLGKNSRVIGVKDLMTRARLPCNDFN